MKTNKLLLLSIILFSAIIVKAQSFSISSDSTHCVRQYGFIFADTTGIIKVTNNNASSLHLKIALTYENVSPDLAIVEYVYGFPHQMLSNSGIGFTDSVILAGNDFVDFRAVFPSANPALPENNIKVTIYEKGDSINTYEILTFTAINCDHPAKPVIIDPTGVYCANDSVYLNANNAFTGYQWSTGETSAIIHVPADSVISIVAYDNLGCLARDTSSVNFTVPYDEEICIVSVDSVTGKNIVVWEKTPMQRTEQFYIYKESFQAGVYNLIGFVPYDSLSVFVDVNSNPLQQAERYKISTVDSCGTESAKSSDHKTIHLTASVGTSNENNLVWDGYDGFSFPTYNIWRGPTPNNMSILAQVASTAFTYSDLTPLVGNNYYKIEAVRTSPCSPTQKSSSYPSSISNSVTLNPLGIDNVSGREKVSVYPNPTQSNITITLGQNHNDVLINVKNVLGAIVASQSYTATNKVQMEINKEAGIYFVEVIVDSNYLVTKQVIKR